MGETERRREGETERGGDGERRRRGEGDLAGFCLFAGIEDLRGCKGFVGVKSKGYRI
jgi:hypothetical protein